MVTPASLRLLASTNNTRGDLFTRLVKDLFFALGYDDLRQDVHKSGREIDIQGVHRLEPKRLVAECKAHAEPMGGAELNKFFGVVSRERDKDERTPVAGYFVSLSGFRETGKEQERETSPQKRMILLDGKQVIDELIRIRVLVSPAEAAEQAGRCVAHAGLKDAVLDEVELLGHESGYLWAVFYSQNKLRTHFALIHADGTALSEVVAADIVIIDKECGGMLHKLRYLAPLPLPPNREALTNVAVEKYCRWVAEDCGFIQLDGLPADSDLSAFRMRLERLFVPLKVVVESREHKDESEPERQPKQRTIAPVGEFLSKHNRFSLLAKPGGGKSTLLKRLAIAYALPERRAETNDQLPERDWLPLFLRCRDLRDRAHRPIRELLDDLASHSSMNGDEASAFRSQIDKSLQSGRALLLIDGMDEISDEGARTTFAQHLRTFLAMFPHVALVVTSREAGYRHVAGVVASACVQATLAPFDKADVTRLCESWHAEVVGNNDKVRSDARQLAATIWANSRIRVLAENPLMLTTLLVVRRCIGDLPNRRVELYREAVRVLIRTWNTEGFEPMDLEETTAQLSYVACAMMNEGVQRVGHRRLLQFLHEARGELQVELQFTRVSPTEFIQRVEYRSSLLMQTGHERIDDELQPVYEFRHLTFQEYLAARGFVGEQYPGRDAGQSLDELLEPHFEDERWCEVIPLAAVMAGRKAESLISRLTAICANRSRDNTYPQEKDAGDSRVVLLRQCLLDEVRVTPTTLRAALLQLARHGNEESLQGSTISLRRGKFGEVFQEVVEEAYFGAHSNWEEYSGTMSDLAMEATFQDQLWELSEEQADTLSRSLVSLVSGNRKQQAFAALTLMRMAYTHHITKDVIQGPLYEQFRAWRDTLGTMLTPNDPPITLTAAWALAWMGRARLPNTPPDPTVILSLYRLWRESESQELRRFAAWAFSQQPLHPRETFDVGVWGDCDAWAKRWLAKMGSDVSATAVLVLAWYRRSPWNDSELARKLSENNRNFRRDLGLTVRELLATLGEPGRNVLEQWDKEEQQESQL